MSQTPEARARDNQTRQIQDSISNVEKHFGELCQLFAGYVRKTARLRDKADLLVREVNTYADTETPNLKTGLKNFADDFAKLQDYRQAEVERLETKVVEPLKSYGAIIKLKRDDLKVTLTARNRESKQMAQLEKTRQRNPSDRQIISQVQKNQLLDCWAVCPFHSLDQGLFSCLVNLIPCFVLAFLLALWCIVVGSVRAECMFTMNGLGLQWLLGGEWTAVGGWLRMLMSILGKWTVCSGLMEMVWQETIWLAC
uniref:CBY1 interacting BAR domain containing 1 n=1 Tax=Leptobrachium leishanense TaxID=445787 RepID=A0A8C5Q1Q7_9ANUR